MRDPSRGRDLDLGSGHFADFVTLYGDGAGDPAGILEYHRAGPWADQPSLEGVVPAGWCASAVFWRRPPGDNRPVWKLNSLEPLDLDPSLACRCGSHGRIRKGRWEPA